MADVTPEFLAAVSEHTGVPVKFLTGDTTADVWDCAQVLDRSRKSIAVGSFASPRIANNGAIKPSDSMIARSLLMAAARASEGKLTIVAIALDARRPAQRSTHHAHNGFQECFDRRLRSA